MTVTNTATSRKPHGRTPLEFKGFWLPSYCPVGLGQTNDRASVLVDADAITWPGGNSKTFVAHYCCDVCGSEWSEDAWSVNYLPGGDPRRSNKQGAA